jgi:hypothetical protein
MEDIEQEEIVKAKVLWRSKQRVGTILVMILWKGEIIYVSGNQKTTLIISMGNVLMQDEGIRADEMLGVKLEECREVIVGHWHKEAQREWAEQAECA